MTASIKRLLAYLLCFHVISTFSVDPVVKLSYATYVGTELANGVTQWLGLRYASPPLGDLRFRAPIDPPVNGKIQLANNVCPFLFHRALNYSINVMLIYNAARSYMPWYWSNFSDARF